MSLRNFSIFFVAIALLTLIINPALAVPKQVVHVNTPDCDPLFIPTDVHEIGNFVEFPPDEALDATIIGPAPIIPCPLNNDDLLPDILVDIRNMTGKVWQEVWYVADDETTITNFDGEANEVGFPPLQEAFRIDNIISDPGGSHHPLVSESMTPDGIWEIGESWQFVLQDYSNILNLPADAITSIGVGSASGTPATGIIDSSGSIIAVEIPEPTTLLLGSLAITGLLIRRTTRRS